METQQRLSDEEERMRLDGLRILARIIARHALAHPEKYPSRDAGEEESPPANARPPSEGEQPRRGGAS